MVVPFWRLFQKSDAFYLLAFFLVIIGLGTALLMLPLSWVGRPDTSSSLSFIDAFFTATSAVCVTGLISVDMEGFSRFGDVVILLLIQIGGLGIISFTSILLTIPGRRLPLRRLNTIKSFFVDGVEYDPVRIVRSIVFFTFIIEGLGTIFLSRIFWSAGEEDWLFSALFHSVSAFCNAGFSLYPDSLESLAHNIPLLIVIMILIVTGGLGFIVLQDMGRRFKGKSRRLNYHSKIVLWMTAFLIFVFGLFFFLLERHHVYKSFDPLTAWVNAIFQAVTPRTAGFDAIPQNLLSQPSKAMTILLMLIGGSPGSIAGGIKTTTAFVVIMIMLKRPDKNGDITVSRHRLTAGTVNSAVVYFLKALALLLTAILSLSIIEGIRGANFDEIVFEVFSAFGTVGLSLGLTPNLSFLGKLILIATMFAGRVGLIALAFPVVKKEGYGISYPEGSLLLG
jgi:trk system potassium uptake protein TrkH